MRIDELHLLAFGPFTARVVSLREGREGLHLIYGPNEAGKSSALRALHDLLFGIPERSADNFQHPYNRLRIGALLSRRGGDQVFLIRRKGRGQTLRREDDATIAEEAVLDRFLDGIDENLFNSMFGLDYEKLVKGGREILQGGGDLGRLIFSAGSGILNLKALQDKLKSDAEALFKPSGQKPKINAALASLAQLRRQLREAQLPGQEWAAHHENLAAAEKRKAEVEAELKRDQQTLQRLKRFQEALPVIAGRRELEARLAEFGSAALLPDDFSERRRELVSALDMARHQRQQAEANAGRLADELGRLELAEELLARAKPIEALQQDVGSQRKAASDRGEMIVRLSACRSDAREILSNLRDGLTLEEAERLRIKKEAIAGIKALGAEFERLMARMEEAREKLPLLDLEIRQAEIGLAALRLPPDTGSLRLALGEAEEYGLLEKNAQAEGNDIRSARETLEQERRRLGIGDPPAAAPENLRIPAIETISDFEKRFDALERELSDARKALLAAQHGIAEAEKGLKVNARAHAPLSPEDLAAARDLRDQGWELVVRDWKTGPASQAEIDAFLKRTPGVRELHEAFAYLMQRSDHIADRLRREADRVVEHARLEAERDAHAGEASRLERQIRAFDREKAVLLEEWQAIWPPLECRVGAPREMEGWVRQVEKWMEKARDLNERHRKAGVLNQTIAVHRARLLEELSPLAPSADFTSLSLAQMIKSARVVIDEAADLKRERDQLARDKAQKENALLIARTRLEESESRLRQWEQAWEAAVSPLGLKGDARPSQANAVLEELQSLFSRLKEVQTLERQVERIDQDARAFARAVNDLAGEVAGDLLDRPEEEAAVAMNQRLKKAQLAEAARAKLAGQLEEESQRILRARESILELESRLQRLCEEAGCDHHRELPEAEKRSLKRRQLETELASVDHHLRQLSGGAGIDSFIREAMAFDPDALAGELKHLEAAVHQLEEEKTRLDQTIGIQTGRLAAMDGGAGAAGVAEEIQIRLGDLENQVDQYARLRIEAIILNKAIERYREKSQGPILKRASALFARITGGSFSGIRAEFDAQGQPMLVGVRKDNEVVTVAGMSDGTADQLYLSLRLAGLETYLETREPMPFIVDDIFIKFDDARAATALLALAEVSRKTQVLCFTHHRHLVDLANQTLDPAVLFNHTL